MHSLGSHSKSSFESKERRSSLSTVQRGSMNENEVKRKNSLNELNIFTRNREINKEAKEKTLTPPKLIKDSEKIEGDNINKDSDKNKFGQKANFNEQEDLRSIYSLTENNEEKSAIVAPLSLRKLDKKPTPINTNFGKRHQHTLRRSSTRLCDNGLEGSTNLTIEQFTDRFTIRTEDDNLALIPKINVLPAVITAAEGRENKLSNHQISSKGLSNILNKTEQEQANLNSPKFGKHAEAKVEEVNENLENKKNVPLTRFEYNEEDLLSAFDIRKGRHANLERQISIEDTKIKNSVLFIYPNSTLKDFWDLLMAAIILYTFMVLPIRLAFFDDEVDTTTWDIADNVIDCLFLFDIVLNFFTTFYDSTNNFVLNHKRIALQYIKTWFMLDLVTVFPFDLVLNASAGRSEYQNLAKIGRLKRISKVTKITKLIRIIRVLREKNTFLENLNRFFKLGLGVDRLALSILSIIFFCHVGACFWIFIGKLDDDMNWIIFNRFEDRTDGDLYLIAWYWVAQTIITTGYGDIPPRNTDERIFTCFMMLGGVVFYSFAIGSISSLIGKLDQRTTVYEEKITTLNEISRDYRLDYLLYNRLKKAVVYVHSKRLESQVELLNSLPMNLKIDLATIMYEPMVQNLEFFVNKPPRLLAYIGPLLKRVYFRKTETIINKGEYANEMYFLIHGTVAGVVPKYHNFQFLTIDEGLYFGTLELISEKPRKYTLKAKEECELFTLDKKNFTKIFFQDFPEYGSEIYNHSLQSFIRYKLWYKEAIEFCKSRNIVPLQDMNGKIKGLDLNIKDTDSSQSSNMKLNEGIEKEEQEQESDVSLVNSEINSSSLSSNSIKFGRLPKLEDSSFVSEKKRNISFQNAPFNNSDRISSTSQKNISISLKDLQSSFRKNTPEHLGRKSLRGLKTFELPKEIHHSAEIRRRRNKSMSPRKHHTILLARLPEISPKESIFKQNFKSERDLLERKSGFQRKATNLELDASGLSEKGNKKTLVKTKSQEFNTKYKNDYRLSQITERMKKLDESFIEVFKEFSKVDGTEGIIPSEFKTNIETDKGLFQKKGEINKMKKPDISHEVVNTRSNRLRVSIDQGSESGEYLRKSSSRDSIEGSISNSLVFTIKNKIIKNEVTRVLNKNSKKTLKDELRRRASFLV